MTNKSNNLLITGGTGSFGQAFLQKSLNSSIFSSIYIYSRDEKKQDDLRKKYNDDRLKFVIGDVRDPDSVDSVMKNINYIFHAAALKQVPSCEFFPLEAVKTNILGTNNILESAERHSVSKVVILSTDKAAYPINSMGMTKALMEKVMIAKSLNCSNNIVYCGTRYGNVMGSRGSVIPLFIDQVKNNKDITITNPDMTRFMMSLDSAVELVNYAFKNGENGDMFVQKSPSSTILNLANSLIKIFDSKSKIKNIGIRHGEKMYETLVTKEEMLKSTDLGDYYKISADTRGLNYNKYFSEGSKTKNSYDEYNSNNTNILSEEELIKILLELPLIKFHLEHKN